MYDCSDSLQRLVHKEVLITFERLRAEIKQIREQYGHVLSDVYHKRKSPFAHQ